MEEKVLTMNDYFEVAKRRKWSLILPAVCVFLVAAIVALAVPSIYKSTSTILIEEQDIPTNFVAITVTGYAEQRLQSIYQRIVSFSRLLDIINKFNLFSDLRNKRTEEEIVEEMRKNITLQSISAETIDQITKRPFTATIAFSLSYEGKNQDQVYRATNELTSMFLEENLKIREKQVADASEFLEEEMARVKAEMSDLDAKMAVFKEANMNELPELIQVNMQSLNNVENNIDRYNEQLRSLKEREGYLQTQLASIPRKAGQSHLATLRAQLVFLNARYSDQYPDVIKIKAEIAELEKQRNNSTGLSVQADNPPDNPAYITLSAQLSGVQADIESVNRQILEFNKTANMYRSRISNTPKTEEEYKAILTERNNTETKFDDLMRKHMEAKVAQGLEKEQKGERFTLIDPARFPENPYKPNRIRILLLGLVLGIGAGVGLVYLKELTDQSIRDADSLTLGTSFPVLAVIPEIVTKEDIEHIRKKQIIMIIGLVVIMIAVLIAFHYFVMDLNVFWAKLMRKVPL